MSNNNLKWFMENKYKISKMFDEFYTYQNNIETFMLIGCFSKLQEINAKTYENIDFYHTSGFEANIFFFNLSYSRKYLSYNKRNPNNFVDNTLIKAIEKRLEKKDE